MRLRLPANYATSAILKRMISVKIVTLEMKLWNLMGLCLFTPPYSDVKFDIQLIHNLTFKCLNLNLKLCKNQYFTAYINQ